MNFNLFKLNILFLKKRGRFQFINILASWVLIEDDIWKHLLLESRHLFDTAGESVDPEEPADGDGLKEAAPEQRNTAGPVEIHDLRWQINCPMFSERWAKTTKSVTFLIKTGYPYPLLNIVLQKEVGKFR